MDFGGQPAIFDDSGNTAPLGGIPGSSREPNGRTHVASGYIADRFRASRLAPESRPSTDGGPSIRDSCSVIPARDNVVSRHGHRAVAASLLPQSTGARPVAAGDGAGSPSAADAYSRRASNSL